MLSASRLVAADGDTSFGPPYAQRPLDVMDSVGYYIDPPLPLLGGLTSDSELARWALEAWDDALHGLLCAVPRPPAQALIRVYWGQIANGLGRMQTLDADDRNGSLKFLFQKHSVNISWEIFHLLEIYVEKCIQWFLHLNLNILMYFSLRQALIRCFSINKQQYIFVYHKKEKLQRIYLWSYLYGAEGQNRTADTGIFRPNF